MFLNESKMGEQHNAPVPTLLSMIFAFFSWVTIGEFQGIVSIVAGCIAIFCGILGGYSHWLNIKEKRKNGIK